MFIYRADGFNPRTSCEVRRRGEYSSLVTYGVSIHAPRVRCDGDGKTDTPAMQVSIHAPRVRCDLRLRRREEARHCFNPRTSCEVRRLFCDSSHLVLHRFNPRTSCEVRRQGRYPADVQVGRGCFAPTCLSEGYFQPAVYCFHDVNMQSSITCSNRRCPGNFL